MSTRSYIGVRNTDETIDYIYCHFDGYPEGVGATLIEHYANSNRVNELMKLGDLSVLGKFIGEKQDFDKRVRDCCLAYNRDRGDVNTEASTDLFEDLIKDQNVDYVYIFDGDHWECYDTQYTLAINLYDQLDIEVNKK
jgi:hypothetical protein